MPTQSTSENMWAYLEDDEGPAIAGVLKGGELEIVADPDSSYWVNWVENLLKDERFPARQKFGAGFAGTNGVTAGVIADGGYERVASLMEEWGKPSKLLAEDG